MDPRPEQILIVLEQERMGLRWQEPRGEAPDLVRPASLTDAAHPAPSAPLELSVAEPSEDRHSRELLVLAVPAERFGGLVGYLVLTVGPLGAAPLVLRRVAASGAGASPQLTVEVRPADQVEARWCYSLRPRLRRVVLAHDDPAGGIEVTVLHAVDLGPANPGVEPGRGWATLSFQVDHDLLARARVAELCEWFVVGLDAELGTQGADLVWPASSVGSSSLNRAAAAAEARLPSGAGSGYGLQLETAGGVTVLGSPVQPRHRYPITVLQQDSVRLAATLGVVVPD